MKKNTDKNLEGQNKTQKARATSPYSESNTNPLHATKEKNKKEKERKETSTPNVNKNTRLSLTTKQRTLIYVQKNRSTRKGNNQTKKINPTKLQTHLNIPEPHGYIKNVLNHTDTLRMWPGPGVPD
jgi:hypothetical protein